MRPPRACQSPRDELESTGEAALRLSRRRLVDPLLATAFLLDLAGLLLHFPLQLIDLSAPLRRAVAGHLAELLLHLAFRLLHLALDLLVHIAPPPAGRAGCVPRRVRASEHERPADPGH